MYHMILTTNRKGKLTKLHAGDKPIAECNRLISEYRVTNNGSDTDIVEVQLIAVQLTVDIK